MPMSLAEAAAVTGMNKTTLLRSIKSGRMTGKKDALGQWQVDEAELLRVYQPAAGAAGERGDTRHDAAAALMEARHACALAEQRLADLKSMLDDTRVDRDRWRNAAEATQRLLADATARRPWWKRLAG
jgi:hypothetical protein